VCVGCTSLQLSLDKDFGGMAGGFPGGEVGVKIYAKTVRRAGLPLLVTFFCVQCSSAAPQACAV
jgi:hypothetical protein